MRPVMLERDCSSRASMLRRLLVATRPARPGCFCCCASGRLVLQCRHLARCPCCKRAWSSNPLLPLHCTTTTLLHVPALAGWLRSSLFVGASLLQAEVLQALAPLHPAAAAAACLACTAAFVKLIFNLSMLLLAWCFDGRSRVACFFDRVTVFADAVFPARYMSPVPLMRFLGRCMLHIVAHVSLMPQNVAGQLTHLFCDCESKTSSF